MLNSEEPAYHWSFLNADYEPHVLDSWGSEGLEEAGRRLGYRLRLTEVVLPSQAKAGTTIPITVTLTNDGYAAPFRRRPAQIIMEEAAGAAYFADVPVDVRDVGPGVTAAFDASVTAPPPGHYGLRLKFADPASTLAALPSYSIQLANAEVWDATNGWNDLGIPLEITRR